MREFQPHPHAPFRGVRVLLYPDALEYGIDTLKDAVLDIRGEWSGLAVVDHAGVGLVAALLEDFFRWDVAGDVVAVAGDHEVVVGVFCFYAEAVSDDDFPSDADKSELRAQPGCLDWQVDGADGFTLVVGV